MFKLVQETFDRLRYKLPVRPRQVQIEITNRCNLDCQMCPREVMGIELEHMEWDKFAAVVDRLTHQEEITLTGWGEPFLHPSIFEMIAYCKERGHRVVITSNGLFTKPSMVESILQSGLDALTFSVDSLDAGIEEGHTSPKVFENIDTISRMREDGKPYLRLQATLHAGRETDLYNLIRYGAMIGCDCINVGRLDRKYNPSLKRPGPKEEARIFYEADKVARQSGIRLDWLQYSVSSGLVRFFYRLMRNRLHQSGKYCLKTFDYTYINRDGDVTPCCLLPQTKMGNAVEENMDSIWQNDLYHDFRENYRKTCGSCDLWTIAMVDEPSPKKKQPTPVG